MHPEQVAHCIHELPRLVDSMHLSCYQHASSVVPCINKLPIDDKWSGIMPFSLDGQPIIGQLKHRQPQTNSSNSRRSRNTTACGDQALSNSDDSMKVVAVPGLWCISGMGGSGFMRGGMAGYLLAQAMAGPLKSEAKAVLHVADPGRFCK